MVQATSSTSTGDVRFGSMVNGVIEYLDSIDFFTSESYIKEGLNKVKQLAVDLAFYLPEGKKQDYIGQAIIKAGAWFVSQWKGANGDRSGYKVAPEIIDKLKAVLTVLDIPNATFEASGPTVDLSIGDLVGQAGAAAAAAAAAAANSAPSTQTPSTAAPTGVNAANVGTEEEKKKAAEEEKKKQSWIKRMTWGIPNWGLVLSGGLLTLGLASGSVAALLKRKKGSARPAGQVRGLLPAAAVANPSRKYGRKSRK